MPYDLILLADTVYMPQSHDALLSTLSALSGPDTVIALYAGYHSGRQVVRSFLEQAEMAGIKPIAPDTWIEVSQEGAVSRPWEWHPVEDHDDLESHEEKARWTLVGRMKREVM